MLDVLDDVAAYLILAPLAGGLLLVVAVVLWAVRSRGLTGDATSANVAPTTDTDLNRRR